MSATRKLCFDSVSSLVAVLFVGVNTQPPDAGAGEWLNCLSLARLRKSVVSSVVLSCFFFLGMVCTADIRGRMWHGPPARGSSLRY